MKLTKIKLGKYIEQYSQKCNIPHLTNDEVSGVNKDKEFFEPSNQVGEDTSKYKIVPPNHFACNLMHVGRDVVLPIAYNHSGNNKIVSPAYFVFKIKDNDEILADYFFLYLKSEERDRFFWFNTDSSIRDGMTWDDFANVEIELPPIDIQKKYVSIYKNMVKNQKSFESGMEDLRLVCNAFIEKLKETVPCEKIGDYIELKRDKNNDDKIKEVYGVSNCLKFIEASSSVDKANLSSYKIVNYQDIAYVPTTHMKIWAVAISDKKDPFVVSPIYEVFGVKNKTLLCPEYLFIWLCREETIRYGYYNSWGSARENFVFDDLCTIKMPIPDIDIQNSIVKIYKTYCARKELNDQLKEQIKNICPILIKGAIKEAEEQ